MSRRPQTSSIARGIPVLGIAVLVLGALTWPLLFTHSGFGGDWNHHLWLMWHQGRAIESNGFPSLFLHSAYSVFYPTYAFYGGTLYAVGGVLSLALGGAPVSAYVLVYILDFGAAFGGWYWLARMAGVSRWAAMVPGLVFITSTYYIVVIYAQGDWPEFTGLSMIPLILAAGLAVLTAERLHGRSALALAGGCVLFFGSHNITVLLGLTLLALTLAALAVCVPEARRRITRRGVLRVGGLVVPAAMVSAWYLLPTLAYSSHTRIGQYRAAQEGLRASASLISLGRLFTFSRPGIPGSLPVLAIAWVLAGIVVLPWGACNRPWTRVLLVCAGLTLGVAIVMTHVGVLLVLPHPYRLIQFTYRLEAYVLLALCGAILAALALARGGARRTRLWTWMALPVCAVSLVGAVQQIRLTAESRLDRYATLESYGEVETGDNEDFENHAAPSIPGRNLRSIYIPPGDMHGDRVSFSTRWPAGTLLATNISAGSYLVHLTGARAVGIDSRYLLVMEASAQTISVSTGTSLPIVLGRALSAVGVAILLARLLLLGRGAYARRKAMLRARPSSVTDSEKSIDGASRAAASPR